VSDRVNGVKQISDLFGQLSARSMSGAIVCRLGQNQTVSKLGVKAAWRQPVDDVLAKICKVPLGLRSLFEGAEGLLVCFFWQAHLENHQRTLLY